MMAHKSTVSDDLRKLLFNWLWARRTRNRLVADERCLRLSCPIITSIMKQRNSVGYCRIEWRSVPVMELDPVDGATRDFN